MEIPLNVVHYYIGMPILAGLSFDILRRNRSRKNPTSTLLGLASMFGAISLGALGLPVIFTHQTRLISIGSFVGDSAFAVVLLLLWLLCLRAFLGDKPKVLRVTQVLVFILAAVCIAEAINRNLMPPDSTEVIRNAAGNISIKYSDTLLYQILSAIDSAALLLTGIYFWREARLAPLLGQQVKIRSVALGFTLISLGFISVAGFPVESQLLVVSVFLGIGFSVIGLGIFLGRILK